mgnify:CR=1 FL=1
MANDYGDFGSGSTGYAHYMQSFDRNFEKSGGSGSHHNGGGNGGCLSCIVAMIGLGSFLTFLIR